MCLAGSVAILAAAVAACDPLMPDARLPRLAGAGLQAHEAPESTPAASVQQ